MNDINALYGQLFDTLKALQDRDSPMDIARAQAVADVAQVIVNAAKVEVEHVKITGGKGGSSFIPAAPALPSPDDEADQRTPTGVKVVAGNVTTHRMR